MNIDHNSVRSGSRTQLQPPRFSTTRDTLMRTRTGLSDQCIDSSDDISHSSHIYQNQPLLVKNMDQYNSYADELNRCDSTVEEPTTRRNRPSSKSRGVRSVKATPTTSGRDTFTKSTQRKGNYPAGDRGLNRGSLSPPSEEYDDYDDFD
ncbi:hypothetical protein CLF_108220 [Clonorchis sinensis]|uniref:Uncharacterized protein n=1 Tax=Clonorchis sinensis TaxID=79923 RepID=G7YHS7_CLOSI|nr:hypothetical protein CLF_108220 [Clonorchis sinensis]